MKVNKIEWKPVFPLVIKNKIKFNEGSIMGIVGLQPKA